MEFRFETKYDQKGLTVMAQALRKTIRKKRSRRSHVFGWCMAALCVLLIAVQRMLDEPWTFRDTLNLRTCIHKRLSRVLKCEIMTIATADETEIS